MAAIANRFACIAIVAAIGFGLALVLTHLNGVGGVPMLPLGLVDRLLAAGIDAALTRLRLCLAMAGLVRRLPPLTRAP